MFYNYVTMVVLTITAIGCADVHTEMTDDFLVIHHFGIEHNGQEAVDCWMLQDAHVECDEHGVVWTINGKLSHMDSPNFECIPVYDLDYAAAAPEIDIGGCWGPFSSAVK